jgi:CMP-N,N'-diacetyllegionaminic acid synthase
MYKNKKILGIIPARGGSKGLPGKNIKEFCGKPLIAWSIEKAKNCEYIDRLIISTDSQEIADVAANFGAEVPFLRENELAEDSTPMVPVIVDAVSRLKSENYDYAVMLQANSPLTRSFVIDEAIKKLIDEDLDVVFTVCPVDHPPQWVLKVENSTPSFAFMNNDNKTIVRRQDEATLYRSTAAVFAVKISTLLANQDTIRLALPSTSQKSGVIITDTYSSVDIDTELEFYLAETIFQKNLIRGEE